jgi:DNA-binding transcriptional LysR family regulator
MELRQLKYFLAVAEELHFRRAAQRLHMSQPPLSEQIRNLEDELGTRLLVRDRTRGVQLTASGIALLTEARKILSQVEKAGEVVRRAERGEVGTLRISLAPAMAYGIVPMILKRFRKETPQVSLQLSEMLTPIQEDALLNGTLDLGFCYGNLQSDYLESESIYSERLILAMPEAHPMAGGTNVNLAKLKGEAFITIPRSTSPGLFDLIAQTCRGAGFSPSVIQEANQFQTAVGFVAVGMGVALVPSSMAALRREGVTYLSLQDDEPVVETLMVRLPSMRYPAIERLMKLARSSAGHL